jgi:methylated-DNA-protein-cysteine methyltransferase-like protein
MQSIVRSKNDARSFTARVVAVLKRIPRGKVATYGQIAALAGNPRGARQVVWVLNSQSESARLPWHRVINARGRIALPRGRGFELQRALLMKERVKVTPAGVINLKEFLWRPRGGTSY